MMADKTAYRVISFCYFIATRLEPVTLELRGKWTSLFGILDYCYRAKEREELSGGRSLKSTHYKFHILRDSIKVTTNCK